MNTTKEAAPGPAGQIGREPRTPAAQTAGNTNANGALAAQSAFAEDLRRKATHPFLGSAEYQRVMAECVAANETVRKPGKFALSWLELDPRVVCALIALLIVIGVILWLGIELAAAALRPGAVFG